MYKALINTFIHSFIQAQAHLKKCLTLLNEFLATRTFLVGERVTLADIGLACNMLMLYAQVMEPKFREPFGTFEFVDTFFALSLSPISYLVSIMFTITIILVGRGFQWEQ